MEEKRKIDFSIGIFDGISENIKEKIKKESSNCELYGVGVYTDEVVINEFGTYPMKNTEERMRLAKEIEGVKFVFPVKTTNVAELKEIIKQAYAKIIENK